jgi:hypothetical protein
MCKPYACSTKPREARIGLLEAENRWLNTQLLGRSTEKTPVEDLKPDQGKLFNEAEALAQAAEYAPVSITIPAHERDERLRPHASCGRVDRSVLLRSWMFRRPSTR